MKIITSVVEIENYVNHLKNEKHAVSLIPTMGNLHDGHISLIKNSEKFKSKKIVSIFINPLQFNDEKDFKSYPVSLEEDLDILEKNNIDCLFMPNKEILSNLNYQIVLPSGFSTLLCGKYRKGHFEGVYKIVKKLFDITCPEHVFFSKKDYQQLILIKFLIYNTKINLVECPTVRDINGLALSSRNRYLTSEQKNVASGIYKLMMKHKYKNEEAPEYIIRELNNQIKTEYCEILTQKQLFESHGLRLIGNKNHKVLFYAGSISGIRLIDNIEIE
ncbi:MAG: pantoate--beta-alanine ligase [Pelagibacterales bacterium]|nr:pantoate--beta-alanine ligase [Pelagibacterales bacterium]